MEENVNKKSCPFCGAEINANAKKCRFCNNWIDEEIECPFCAEKIKASAKKCRFCGEWLPQSDVKEDIRQYSTKENKSLLNISFLKDFSKKKTYIIGLVLIILICLGILWRVLIYIPTCSNETILNRLEDKVKTDFKDIGILVFQRDSVKTLSKNEKGYSCRISAYADDAPLVLEYTYTKTSVNEYNYTTNVVLPDCYDGTIKQILTSLIKKSDYMNFKDTVSGVDIENASVENYDKDIPKYSCEADVRLIAKPGRAFVVNSWNISDAEDEVSCKVRYESLFCGNGYTTCAGLNKITNCKYEED